MGNSLAVLKVHTNWLESVAFSPDGKTIASAGRDNTVQLWPGNLQKSLSLACNKLRYHSVLLEAQTEDAKIVGDVCLNLENTYWDNNTKAQFQRDRGLAISANGNYERGAIELFAAQKRNSKIDLNPH
uniref:WD40 repeat domain-containing protein n=1 Tax=Anaplasma marginale TaxID=770 RepID=UPI0005B2F700